MKKLLLVVLSILIMLTTVFATACTDSSIDITGGNNGSGNDGVENTENVSDKYTSEEIYSMAKDCAVEIITYDKNGNSLALGSGFTYTSDGQIVTNYHVIDEAYSANVYVGEIMYSVIKVLAYDVDRDIAILKIDASNLKTLKISEQTANTGATVYALGSSRGLTSTFSRGIVTSSNRILDGVTYVQHDAAISNGNSGGPLINERCEIIGINTLTFRESQNLNFAIAPSEIKKLSFVTPMTLKEVYDKECNAFLKACTYIGENGTWESDGGYYFILLGNRIASTGEDYTWMAMYYPSDNEISVSLVWNHVYYLSIFVTGYGNTYDYGFWDEEYNYNMFGEIYLQTFSSETTALGYTSTNIPYESVITSTRRLAASQASLLITLLSNDLASVGMSIKDFGFINF